MASSGAHLGIPLVDGVVAAGCRAHKAPAAGHRHLRPALRARLAASQPDRPVGQQICGGRWGTPKDGVGWGWGGEGRFKC